MGASPRVSQPTTWLPKGSPLLACKDMVLDLVTIIAKPTKPTYIREMRLVGGLNDQ
jgi:hypothetical protein